MQSQFDVIERVPTLDEYQEIVMAVGWEENINFEAVQKALDNTLYSVVASLDGKAIGMGRIVGDGAIYFYLQDLAILPQYQEKGAGNLIMEKLLAYLKENAPPKAFIGLFADSRTYAFYEQYGFGKHRTLTAMFKVSE